MIRPVVKLLLADGTKRRVELYDRPPALTLEFDTKEGNKEQMSFIRCGPDEYRQQIVQRKKGIEATVEKA